MRQQTRTALSIITTLTIGAIAGLVLWQTIAAFGNEHYAIASGGAFASLAMLTLFSVSLQESARRLRKRGYSRPVSTGGGLFESAVRVWRQDAHPVVSNDFAPVKFDSGKVVNVEIGDMYAFCMAGYHDKKMFAWHNNKAKMSKDEWDARRHLLVEAGVVEVDGNGAIRRLLVMPWPAAVAAIRRETT